IRIGVGRDGGRLARTEFGEIDLIDVEFRLKIVEIGQRDDVALRAAIAGEAGRDELAAFDIAFKDDAGNRGADDGVFQLRSRESERAFGLFDLGAHGVNVFTPRADANQLMGLLIRRVPGDLRVVTGLRVVERLLRHNALLNHRARTIERHSGVLQIGAHLLHVGMASGGLFRARTVFQSGQPRFEHSELSLRFGHPRAKFFVFKPDQRLALLYAVALFDADPGDSAGNFRGQRDLVRRDYVAGGVEYGHAGAGAGRRRRSGSHTRSLDFDRRIELGVNEQSGSHQ